MPTEPHSRAIASPPLQRCTIWTPDRGYITEGIAVRVERPAGTEVRITELSEPGALLMAYVGRGVRRFRLIFGDGIASEAELISTAWQSSGRRLCRFALTAFGESEPVPTDVELTSVVTPSSIVGPEHGRAYVTRGRAGAKPARKVEDA
jgi:hypothetical protein